MYGRLTVSAAVPSVYIFIFSNLVALISMVIFFREQLEDPKRVSFELREKVLGISGRTGMYAFTALFLVLFPLWLLYLSNYMAVVVLVAEVCVSRGCRGAGGGSAESDREDVSRSAADCCVLCAVCCVQVAIGIWWLTVEYEHIKTELGARGQGAGSSGDDDDPEFPKLFYGPSNPYTGGGGAVAQYLGERVGERVPASSEEGGRVSSVKGGRLPRVPSSEWDRSVRAGGDTGVMAAEAIAHSLATAEGTSAASGSSAVGLLSRADPSVLLSGISRAPRQGRAGEEGPS